MHCCEETKERREKRERERAGVFFSLGDFLLVCVSSSVPIDRTYINDDVQPESYAFEATFTLAGIWWKTVHTTLMSVSTKLMIIFFFCQRVTIVLRSKFKGLWVVLSLKAPFVSTSFWLWRCDEYYTLAFHSMHGRKDPFGEWRRRGRIAVAAQTLGVSVCPFD